MSTAVDTALASSISISLWSLAEDAQLVSTSDQLKLLDAEERKRLQSLRKPELAQRYLAAHAGMRLRLADWLAIPAQAIRLATTPAGKPFLIDHSACNFSLSHSHAFAMLAIAKTPVGIDIEAILAPEHITPELLDQVLTPQERRHLQSLPLTEQASTFTTYWVCKEAVMKATGLGCELPPDGIAIDLLHGRAELTPSWANRLGQHWQCQLVSSPEGHRAAVAIAYPK